MEYDDFNCNNFVNNENEDLIHFENIYDEEISKNIQSDINEEASQRVAVTIRQWLDEMNKNLEYVYNFEPSCDYEQSEVKPINTENRICDPYITVDDINENDIEDITNIANNKKISQIQGKCAVRLRDGTELTGRWVAGARQGPGTCCSPQLERLGVRLLSGSYRDGCLAGVVRAHYRDTGEVREGWAAGGLAEGPWRGEVRGTGVVWLGRYRRGLPTGLCWEAVQGGMWRVGWLEADTGAWTGPRLASLYPDLRTALVGHHRGGQLVRGAWARVTSVSLHQGLLLPTFEIMSNNEFRRWQSSKLELLSPPHLRDPYEDQMVEVCTSSIRGSGDGLRLRRDVEAGTIVAFYHGLRMKAADESPWGAPTGYGIMVEWDRDKKDTSDVLDLSPESIANYSATLAHKVNHSFKPNCEWVHALHPCYGKIPAISTLEPLRRHDELFIHYGFDMDEAPQWYKQFWMMQE